MLNIERYCFMLGYFCIMHYNTPPHEAAGYVFVFPVNQCVS